MLTFRVLSALLKYPSPELKAATAQAEHILRSEGILGGAQLESVCAFIHQIQRMPQLEAESSYIDAFDRGRSTSLYLFEHIHGESRDRGQAMVRLLARYRMHGLDLSCKELPDFLPLFLEFLSTCRATESRNYLSEVIDIIRLLGHRLRQRARSLDEGEDQRDDVPAALDAAWEEAPVTFDDATLNVAQGQMDSFSQARRAPKQS